MACKYQLAWVGPCDTPCVGQFCAEHEGVKCTTCGDQATRQCGTASSLVCGAPLCDKCNCRCGVPRHPELEDMWKRLMQRSPGGPSLYALQRAILEIIVYLQRKEQE